MSTIDTTHEIADCDVSPIPASPPDPRHPSHAKLLNDLRRIAEVVNNLPAGMTLEPYFAIWLAHKDFAQLFRGQEVSQPTEGCLEHEIAGVRFSTWLPREIITTHPAKVTL